ncbi:efflux RND transporter periplasmic adaptor subunit [Chitinophaga sedimenti]|uniref:efflux RND transporter periplasmic adaptor subunit n=1 Tax=Chitinophaga sedimenti TaxID=2033606 RepID=UPI002002BE6A|nr:efflux RND transporter periplasmic adaptor subunit [Chitinophaga sedimenti]MCK7556215.1 efflux RND transporter periplasmic adaptor subunit [Chitinophaga sedimenti]
MWLRCGICAACIAICAWSCNGSAAAGEESGEARLPRSTTAPVSVTVVTASQQPFYHTIRTNGKLVPLREQTIISETSGSMVSLRVKAGTVVAAGAIIAQIDDRPIRLRLERAHQLQFNGQKEYESQLLGYENLLKNKSTAQADTIKTKLRISSGLAIAEQDIREAQYELSKTIIRAPFSGMVADVAVQQGQYIKAGQDLMKVYHPGQLLVNIRILESEIGLLHIGTPASCIPVSDPQTHYPATVQEINPYVAENGMVNLKLLVAGSSKLFPGMNCSIEVRILSDKSLVVPKEAVVTRNGKKVVFTLKGDVAVWNYVETGSENGKEIVLLTGISPGDKVITSNNQQLTQDTPVRDTTLVRRH